MASWNATMLGCSSCFMIAISISTRSRAVLHTWDPRGEGRGPLPAGLGRRVAHHAVLFLNQLATLPQRGLVKLFHSLCAHGGGAEQGQRCGGSGCRAIRARSGYVSAQWATHNIFHVAIVADGPPAEHHGAEGAFADLANDLDLCARQVGRGPRRCSAHGAFDRGEVDARAGTAGVGLSTRYQSGCFASSPPFGVFATACANPDLEDERRRVVHLV